MKLETGYPTFHGRRQSSQDLRGGGSTRVVIAMWKGGFLGAADEPVETEDIRRNCKRICGTQSLLICQEGVSLVIKKRRRSEEVAGNPIEEVV